MCPKLSKVVFKSFISSKMLIWKSEICRWSTSLDHSYATLEYMQNDKFTFLIWIHPLTYTSLFRNKFICHIFLPILRRVFQNYFVTSLSLYGSFLKLFQNQDLQDFIKKISLLKDFLKIEKQIKSLNLGSIIEVLSLKRSKCDGKKYHVTLWIKAKDINFYSLFFSLVL